MTYPARLVPIIPGLIGALHVLPKRPHGAILRLVGYPHRAVLRHDAGVTAVTVFVWSLPVPVPLRRAEFADEAEAWRWARMCLAEETVRWLGVN